MSERLMHNNEIISLTVLLLMVIALVASQADATVDKEARAAAAITQDDRRAVNDFPVRATIEGHINGVPLTISIDTTAEVGRFSQVNH